MSNNNRSATGLAVLTVMFVLTLTADLYASGGGGGIPAAKWWDLLYRTLNFAGLAAILIFFLKKPIANALKGRQQAIREQFEELEARKSEAELLYKEHEAKLAQIDTEAKRIIDAAVSQAQAEKHRIIEEATRQAGDIKRQAEMAVHHEIIEAKRNLRNDIAEQAAMMAEELIKKNLTAEDQVKLVKENLEKVGVIQ